MAEINLAPGTEYAGVVRHRRRRTLGLATLLIAVVAIVWGGLFIYQQRLVQEKRDADRRLSAVEAEIARLGDQGKRVTLFENRLVAVDSLLTAHIAWDPFLQDLEKVLPPPALINRLKVSLEDGTIELTGETPDLDVVAQTLASLVSTSARPTIFTSGALQSVKRIEQENPAGEPVSVRYDFSADLTFDPSRLQYGRQ